MHRGNQAEGRCLFRRIVSVLFLYVLAGATAHARLSAFALPPNWASLKAYQQTISRSVFVAQIDQLYAPDGGFWDYAALLEDRVIFFADSNRMNPVGTLWFAPETADSNGARPVPRIFPSRASHAIPDPAHPLAGLTLCLDPGHIGGAWAKQEERWFKLGDDPAIEEAALNLAVCHRLEPLLTQAGARVVWAKEKLEPTTKVTFQEAEAEAFRTYFGALGWNSAAPEGISQTLRQRAALLYYRTAEIRARAERVTVLNPDLTLCIHYNAAAWPNPLVPRREDLVDADRLVVFVNGTYSRDELSYEDERYDVVRKTLEQSAETELKIAEKVAARMARQLGLPPETYINWPAVRHAGQNPYVYARNLIANRLYPGPVVFVEGPYMNAKHSYARMVAGDYEGVRMIDGRQERSLHREYAEAVCAGVIDYFVGHP